MKIKFLNPPVREHKSIFSEVKSGRNQEFGGGRANLDELPSIRHGGLFLYFSDDGGFGLGRRGEVFCVVDGVHGEMGEIGVREARRSRLNRSLS